MGYLKSTSAAVVIGALIVFAIYAFGVGGPSGSLIKSSMSKVLEARNKNCIVTKITFVRAGSFIPEAHRDFPKGTAFYPVRVEASVVFVQDDGSRSDPRQVARTLYFYKKGPAGWGYEVNSF